MNLLELCEQAGVRGFMHCNELQQLTELAIGKDVLEVGSFKGLTACCMAFVAQSVFCVDTFRANSAGQQQMAGLTTLAEFQQAVARFNHVRYFVGTSAAASAAPAIPAAFDLVFLDALHTYPDVKADIARWWPRVRAGGIMVFHDYGHHDFPGVQQAVDEVFGPLPNRVVTLAWLTKP